MLESIEVLWGKGYTADSGVSKNPTYMGNYPPDTSPRQHPEILQTRDHYTLMVTAGVGVPYTALFSGCNAVSGMVNILSSPLQRLAKD